MRLTFLGTRGEIAARSRRHLRHSSLEISRRGRRVMVDCGADWRTRLARLRPDAIVLTHAHPDHAAGLAGGAPCPVHATAETWRLLGRYPIVERRLIEPRRREAVCGVSFEAFPVEHSLRAPAVGFRIGDGRAEIFYVPDLVAIGDREAALAGIALYVGDGASLARPIVRRRDGARIGHASARQQLEWCRAAGVPRALLTHCGTGVVTGDARRIAAWLRATGAELGLEVGLACDGMALDLPAAGGDARVPRR